MRGGVGEDVVHGVGQVVAGIVVDHGKDIDPVEVFAPGPDAGRTVQDRLIQAFAGNGIGHEILPLIQVVAAAVTLDMKVPQARSITVIKTGQSRSVARLVRS